MPVISFRHWVPRPVRSLEVFENNSRVLVTLRRIAPDIQIGIIDLLDQPAKIAHPIARAVLERFDMQLIDDRVLVPKRIGLGARRILSHGSATFAAEIAPRNFRKECLSTECIGGTGAVPSRTP